MLLKFKAYMVIGSNFVDDCDVYVIKGSSAQVFKNKILHGYHVTLRICFRKLENVQVIKVGKEN